MEYTSAPDNAAYFDGIAKEWDQRMILGQAELAGVGECIAGLGIGPGDTVLDVGCGTGLLFPFILKLIGSDGRLLGLDISPAMLEEAAKKFSGPAVELINADIESFLKNQKANSVGAIICFSAFPHFENKPGILKGFHKILLPGRRFSILHVAGSLEINEFHTRLPAPVNRHTLPPINDLAHYSIDAGFTIVDAIDRPGLFRLTGQK